MGSSLSISVPGLKPEEATHCLVASAMDKGYEVEKVHKDQLKFRIQPLNESDPTPTEEVLIIKGHGVFNIQHTEKRIGEAPVPLTVAEVITEEQLKDEIEGGENAEEAEKEVEEELEVEALKDGRPTIYFASIERYCAESDIIRV